VAKCETNQKSGISMFKFPKKNELNNIWKNFCGRDKAFNFTSSSVICNLHFDKNLIRQYNNFARLTKDAVPTINKYNKIKNNENENENLTILENKNYLCKIVQLEHNYCIKKSPTVNDRSFQCILDQHKNQKDENKQLKKEIFRLKQKMKTQAQKINYNVKNKNSKIKGLTSYQSKLILRKTKFGTRYDTETIKKGIEMRAVCGIRGYNYLKKNGYPLPSIGFLNRKIKNLNFDSGILDDFILFLGKNVCKMAPDDRRAGLFFDEMSLIPGHEVDPSTKLVLGRSSFPGDTAEATHALVIMVCGLKRRWKQVVAYYFTGIILFYSIYNTNVNNLTFYFRKLNE
jgi:hypothetical protein